MLSSIEFANKLFENGISLKEANELIHNIKFGNCIVLKLKLEEYGGISIISKND